MEISILDAMRSPIVPMSAQLESTAHNTEEEEMDPEMKVLLAILEKVNVLVAGMAKPATADPTIFITDPESLG